jgi:SAM-dependent methyltransferase
MTSRPLLLCPDPPGEFRRYRNRLALFRPIRNGSEYWRQHWADPARRAKLLARGESGDLGEYEPLVERYASRELPILEAGCGLAQVVAALTRRGFSVAGVDYDREVVRFVNDSFPALDVRFGDVTALDIPDASIGLYMSLGVVEHFADGPSAALREAGRVLHPRGHALISVPYLNRARRAYLEATGRVEVPDQPGYQFYQYYFSPEEFEALLNDAGLGVIDRTPLFVEPHLLREHPLFVRYWRSPLCRHRMREPIRRALRNAPKWMLERYGHMMMYVCRPTGAV